MIIKYSLKSIGMAYRERGGRGGRKAISKANYSRLRYVELKEEDE